MALPSSGYIVRFPTDVSCFGHRKIFQLCWLKPAMSLSKQGGKSIVIHHYIIIHDQEIRLGSDSIDQSFNQ